MMRRRHSRHLRTIHGKEKAKTHGHELPQRLVLALVEAKSRNLQQQQKTDRADLLLQ